jgi:hypothetical protein
VPLHVVAVTHTRSVVAVRGAVWNWDALQVVAVTHTRLVVAVGAVASNCVGVH